MPQKKPQHQSENHWRGEVTATLEGLGDDIKSLIKKFDRHVESFHASFQKLNGRITRSESTIETIRSANNRWNHFMLSVLVLVLSALIVERVLT